jgi:hypothetical protein
VRDGERAAEAQGNRAQEAAPGDYPSAVRDGVSLRQAWLQQAPTRLRRCLLSADPGQTSTILHPELRQSVRPRNSTARADTAAKRGLIGQDASSTRSGGVSSRWPGRRRWRGSRGGGVRSESFARSGTPASRTGCIRSRWFQERAQTGRRPAGAAHPAATTAMSTKVTGLWNPQGRRSCAVDALGY